MNTNTNEASQDFLDDLAALVDAEDAALERHDAELGELDSARDLLYEAQRVADAVVAAGDDYLPPEDLEARVLASIDADAAPAAVVPSEAGPVESSTPKTEAAEPVGVSERAPEVTSLERDPLAAQGQHQEPDVAPERSRAATTETPRAAGKGLLLLGLVGAGGLAFAAAAALAIAFGLGAFDSGAGPLAGLTGPSNVGPASVTRVVRAADDNRSGIEVALEPGSTFTAATAGASLPPGSRIRTDARTRLLLTLADGSLVTLDRSTEVRIGEEPRTLHLTSGELLADVVHLDDGSHARFITPSGEIEVLGTKFVLTTDESGTSVQVTRGEVRASAKGESVAVKAGEEGTLPVDGRPSVAPAGGLAQAISFSELDPLPGEDLPIQGIGELRARRPGEREERERPLTLSDHRVKVRIVGGVARTEIEETFQNDDSSTLEGVYRFPLPPNARIASLALEVDGQWEDGAFVAKERARRIFQGVIRNATPRSQRRRQEEYIWVPGPWRDPALLEWQNGGRVELRIFPIPAHGSRRVRIAYEQEVEPHGSGRRYTYPLPFSADDSTRVGNFDVDIRVAGLGDGRLEARGYGMRETRDGSARRMRFSARDFRPAGSLIVDYTLPGGEPELRTYSYAAPASATRVRTRSPRGRGPSSASRALRADDRAYVLFTLRPELPAWTQERRTEWVLVVDSSQSMVGDRFAQTTRLVRTLVGELDRRDRVRVLACDATCRPFSRVARPASAELANELGEWLGNIRPAGSSDLIEALREATAAPADPERERRVLYIGDGRSSTGHRLPSTVGPMVRELAERSQSRVSALGVGDDADSRVLETVARAGTGHFIRWVPGQGAIAAAMAVLESSYGASLESPVVQLPAGVTAVAPRVLPTIRSGQEVLVVGRLNGDRLEGEVKLSGKIGGRAFEQRYPVNAAVSRSPGNGFVPRVWANARIEDLEREGRGEDIEQIIALSETYGVLSRETSLLVLESPAMFRAYGIDRTGALAQWSGEEEADVSAVDGMIGHASAQTALGGLRSRSGGGGISDSDAAALSGLGYASAGAARRGRSASREARRRPPSVRSDSSAMASRRAPDANLLTDEPRRERNTVGMRASSRRPPATRRGGMWMRRVWHREGFIEDSSSARRRLRRDEDSVARAETALRQEPNSRDRHRALVRALSRAGELERAREVVESWMERDRLDPEALTYFSDLLGRQGDADSALRELTGVVDLAPDNLRLQERLAKAFERSGDARRACSHRVAIAEIRKGDPDSIGRAVRCERALGERDGAERLLALLPDERSRRRAEERSNRSVNERVRGELMLRASWRGGEDLDLSVITPQGTRLSWMGGRTSVVGDEAAREGEERLGLRRAARGSYYIEISRRDGDAGERIEGEVRINLLGERRSLPFTLTGARTVVGLVRVAGRWRMQRVGGFRGRLGRR
ncbi:MAG: VWA domain-containing protein [Deltaproteobacteria bacterium]|nr:VWA domain-containing protein [Deltaproteobacteria bacterium]